MSFKGAGVEVPFMVETSRLLLRPFVADDLDALSQIFSDPDVMRYVGPRRPCSRDETRVSLESIIDHWSRNGFGLWAAVFKPDQTMIGFCGLCFLDGTQEIEVGYRLSRRYWGLGLATEGGLASLRFGFDKLGLDRIVAVVDPQNSASRHVLEKLGLRYLKNARYYNSDLQYFAIDREHYEPGPGPFEARQA
jgi:RimJ/RimL family protein N-acetyltransferase